MLEAEIHKHIRDLEAENAKLLKTLHDVTMIFASRPDIYALTGFAERPVIERARALCNSL